MNYYLLANSIGIGALIGYVTNYIAIKLLFKPYKPIKIGSITIFPQGVIPREKKALAKKVGEVVKNYILSENEIRKIITSKEVKDEIERFLDEKIENFTSKDINEFLSKEEIADKFSKIIIKIVEEKFSMFASFINIEMIKEILLKLDIPLKVEDFIETDRIKEILKKEIFLFLEKEVPQIFVKAHVDKVVEEKVASFDEKTLEEMLFTLMKKHFSFINFAGAFLGGIIGLIQYFVITS
ncbi:DUF445 family protein [Caminibacter mediatlanticus TB-2]|uniref:DUF445 family protein n=1 Tax=Caminibacter mediatlanticus TB-2 TaxID=391592 RepID=A0ABX5V722_9BACT|nr:DUF445 family protein [Caminibacter mediatlanticus]QCT94013.1 DUF445 family protein [Caminibacter mediatlanticus TB-2]